MTTISAKTVSELRERTGAALMDCKRALQEANGDIEAAIDNLRKSGLKNAEKRAGRSTAFGRVQAHYASDGRSGAMVALTCETEPVSATEPFLALLDKLLRLTFDKRLSSPEALLEQKLDGTSVQETVKLLSGKLGENVLIPKVAFFENKAGYVGGYIHHNHKVAGLVSLTTDAPPAKAAEMLKQLGMHITFHKPTALSREHVPAEAVEREKAVHAESDEVKSKPADKRDMIVKGKLDKFFAKEALIEQPWFTDDKQSVKKLVESTLGPKAKVEGFALFHIGA